MSERAALDLALLVLGAGLVAMVVGLVVVKVARHAGDRAREASARALMPQVLAALDADGPVVHLGSGRHQTTVERIAGSLLPKLRGADRARLAELLEQGGVIDQARRHLRSRSAVRRQRAAELLGAAGVHDAEGALVDRLHDRDPGVRMAAARALGKIGASAALGELVRAMADRRVPGNTVSIAVLRIGPSCADGLAEALGTTTGATKAVVAELAGALGLTETTGLLVDALRDPVARRGAAHALGRVGARESVARLVHELDRQLRAPDHWRDAEYAAALITALGQIGDRTAIPALTASLARSHRLSFAAAEALAQMGPRRSQRSMQERARSTVPSRTTDILTARRARTSVVVTP